MLQCELLSWVGSQETGSELRLLCRQLLGRVLGKDTNRGVKGQGWPGMQLRWGLSWCLGSLELEWPFTVV